MRIRVTFSAPGTPLTTRENSDFWRIMMDDGYYREMQVSSSRQIASSVRTEGGVTKIVYNGITDDAGRTFDVTLTLTIAQLAGAICAVA